MSHPYEAFANTVLWNAVDAALAELQTNRDIDLRTPRDLVIGYLCQQLAAAEGASVTADDQPTWVVRGRTIRQLIKELQSFENQDMEVRVSIDSGRTHKAISLVGKPGGAAVLSNSESVDDAQKRE